MGRERSCMADAHQALTTAVSALTTLADVLRTSPAGFDWHLLFALNDAHGLVLSLAPNHCDMRTEPIEQIDRAKRRRMDDQQTSRQTLMSLTEELQDCILSNCDATALGTMEQVCSRFSCGRCTMTERAVKCQLRKKTGGSGPLHARSWSVLLRQRELLIKTAEQDPRVLLKGAQECTSSIERFHNDLQGLRVWKSVAKLLSEDVVFFATSSIVYALEAQLDLPSGVQLEALFGLNTLTAVDAGAVVAAGAVGPLVRLLSEGSSDVQTEAARAVSVIV